MSSLSPILLLLSRVVSVPLLAHTEMSRLYAKTHHTPTPNGNLNRKTQQLPTPTHCRYGLPRPLLVLADTVDIGNVTDESAHGYKVVTGNLSEPYVSSCDFGCVWECGSVGVGVGVRVCACACVMNVEAGSGGCVG